MNTVLSILPELLLPWYEMNKRNLPWRQDTDPYHIWLSEIMLQQTRVEAVKGYYYRFLSANPTIAALAACDDETLHKLWEGLGYYSRVRNLKKAAAVIINENGGVFPQEYSQVLKLPGIGEYTAGAICSIAFGQPTPAVDGNVLRVMARLQNNDTPIDSPTRKKEVQSVLSKIYPAQAGAFTQALMELGATLCGPNRKPECSSCPVQSICQAFSAGTQESLPIKTPKKPRRTEKKTVFILRCGNAYALEKRPDTGLLASLWQFPNTEGFLDIQSAVNTAASWGLEVSGVEKILHKTHIFTHIQWEMQGIYMEVCNPIDRFAWMRDSEMDAGAALPTAFRQFREEENHV